MIDGDFAYALTAGMIVTVNPCGFAMLPAYLSSFLGLSRGSQKADSREKGGGDVVRALVVSAAVTLGFMAVFLVLGTLARAGANAVFSISQWLTIVIGIGLVALGVAMVFGYRPPIFTPKIEKGGQGRSFRSMFVFGVSYALASLGCSIPAFLIAVFVGGRQHGLVSGFLSFLTYGIGFGLVLTGLTLSLALAQGGFLKVLRKTLRFIDRASAILLILAGLYLAWYGLSEVRSTAAKDGVTGRATDYASKLQSFVENHQGVIVVLVILLVGAAVGRVVVRRRATASST
jgi:cytochrome c-type biogenesis protein